MILDIRWPAETFLMRKLEALAQCGYRITVGTSDRRGAAEGGIRVARLPGGRREWGRLAWLLLRALKRDRQAAWAGVKDLWRARGGYGGARVAARRWLIAAGQPQIVHWEWTLAGVECLPLILEQRRWRATVSCRGSHVTIAPVNPRRAEATGRLGELFRQVDGVHAVSDAILEEACALGLERGKAAVIRPAVDPERFLPAEGGAEAGALRVVMTGTLAWVKAMEYALLAFRKLLDAGARARLEVIGDGGKAERARLLYTVEDLGLRGHVQWSGRVDPGEVPSRLRGADVLLHSSLSEGISNAVLEAMACGLPIVVTDAGGMREAVRDGVEGFVVPVRDVEAMAEALGRLARDPELRRRMGAAARQRVLEEFTLERQTREWRAFYEGVADRWREAGG